MRLVTLRHSATLLFAAAFTTVLLIGCASESADTGADPAVASSPTDTMQSRVFFVTPTDGDTLGQTVTFEMGAENVAIVPAGDQQPNSGHLHILINAPFVAAGEVIPADDQHIHFGDGSTTAELTLPAGTHTIRLQLADWAHRGMEGEGYRDEITVTIE